MVVLLRGDGGGSIDRFLYAIFKNKIWDTSPKKIRFLEFQRYHR